MAAILIGPLPTTVITAIVLLFQALFMAHGGLTTWGANTVNMGILGTFAAFGAFLGARRLGLPIWVGGALAGIIADLVTYAGTALTMSLALHGERGIFDVTAMIFAAFLPTQIPLAILEGALTAIMVNFVVSRRPDIAGRLGLLRSNAKGVGYAS
jgi:cobalt/nickel transport system permease protein